MIIVETAFLLLMVGFLGYCIVFRTSDSKLLDELERRFTAVEFWRNQNGNWSITVEDNPNTMVEGRTLREAILRMLETEKIDWEQTAYYAQRYKDTILSSLDKFEREAVTEWFSKHDHGMCQFSKGTCPTCDKKEDKK